MAETVAGGGLGVDDGHKTEGHLRQEWAKADDEDVQAGVHVDTGVKADIVKRLVYGKLMVSVAVLHWHAHQCGITVLDASTSYRQGRW